MGSSTNRMILVSAAAVMVLVLAAPEKTSALELRSDQNAAPSPALGAEDRAGVPASSYSVRLSPYDALAQKYAAEHDLDWRLVAAVMSAESAFDPEARSVAGAVGLMQLMPPTAADMGVADFSHPEHNVRAGTKYLRWLHARFRNVPEPERQNFVIAAYNAGPGHVRDAQRLAKWLGWDPNRWDDSVERAILLLERPENYAYARYGYCRGSETVAYVARVRAVHAAYVGITDWADAFFAGPERRPEVVEPRPSVS